tara:strand:- start:10380 stop:10748 length:369 start_codon:yes stop_codon:yes gene_type:complete
MKISKQQLKQIIKEELESTLVEDGHEDVPSARRAMKTIIEDAGQMLQALEQAEGPLPTWWTNKMAVAANNLNKMRDYLLVSGDSMEEAIGSDDETDTRQAIQIAKNREAIKAIKKRIDSTTA